MGIVLMKEKNSWFDKGYKGDMVMVGTVGRGDDKRSREKRRGVDDD